jgi:predicted nuclease of predicted toxin-antitoxin system
MKLLFDQNLSPRLIRRLADLYPGSDHVFERGLERADDSEVWEHAHEHGFMITSKDSDFNELSVIHGFHPKWSGYVRETAPPVRSRKFCDRSMSR